MGFKMIFSLGFLLLFGHEYAESKTLVVSDIDDTIKISHVLDTEDALAYGIQTENAFLGMNQLYNLFLVKWGNEVDFLYLSNAPEWLMEGLHHDFLSIHAFPSGRLSLLDGYSHKETHKLKKIRKTLSSGLYQRALFFGDNGEKDAAIYNQIRREFPKVQVMTFIHQLYSVHNGGSQLYAGQVGYVTPVEILFELEERKVFKTSDIGFLVDSLSKDILATNLNMDVGVIMFPTWKDCRDFRWKWKDFGQYAKFVLERCQENPEAGLLWNLFKSDNKK